MDFRIRYVKHSLEEIEMGQVIFYQPDQDVDGVSATSNVKGFTTLTALARAWGIPLDSVATIAAHSNKLEDKQPWCMELENPRRSLYVVPRTQGSLQTRNMARKLLRDAVLDCNNALQLSHFNFIQGDLPETEISAVLEVIRDCASKDGPPAVIIDIDVRKKSEFERLYDRVLSEGDKARSDLIHDEQKHPPLKAARLIPEFIQQKQSVLDVVDSQLGVVSKKGGEVFSSGLSALTKGEFYVLGLNPCSGGKYPTVRDHVANWDLIDFSAFTHQSWHPEDWNRDCYELQETIDCKKRWGITRHQRAVVKLITSLTDVSDMRTIFATNAIFAASKSAESFRAQTGLGLNQAFELCWPLHKHFLNIVRPKVIICLGLGEFDSSYALIRAKSRAVKAIKELKTDKWKCHYADINLGTVRITPLVIGVKHPSRFGYQLKESDENDMRSRMPFLGKRLS